ncbi:MAG: T9SS type A sorting domain-containing protein [Bacteroidota bacterium]
MNNPDSFNRINIKNSIFYGNTSSYGNDIAHIRGVELNLDNISVDVSECDSIGGFTTNTIFNRLNCNNILFEQYPEFQDTSTNNFILSPCSPAINAGNNDFVTEISTDLKGNPRVQDGRVDLGAYEAPPMGVEIAVVRNSCSGTDNGQVLFEIENACSPYEVNWERAGVLGNGAENLAAGDYQFTIMDSRGNSRTQSATIAENPALEANFTIQNASAADVLDGEVFVERVSGGQAPYQVFVYDLANEQFRNQDNLQVGKYQLIIKDANGCEQIYDFMIDVLSNTTALEDDLIIQLTPNPVAADQNAFLNITNPNHHQILVALFDAQGRLLQEQTVVRTANLNLLLPSKSGLYFIRVMEEDGGSQVLKLIQL